jgi:hypothetical protein
MLHQQTKESTMIRWTKSLALTIQAAALTLALTGSPANAVLQGDCENDGSTFIGNVQQCVNIFLNPALYANCTACDQMADGSVDIADVQGAANCFLNPVAINCLMVTPVPTATQAVSPTNTPVPTSTPTNTVPAPTNTPTNTVPAPTNTPTNTVPAPTSTPSNTIPAPTNTPTNTPVPTSTPTNTQGEVNTPTPTATIDSSQPAFDATVEVLGGGGLAAQCQGTCASGPRQGLACAASSQCRVCNGGTNAGNACVTNGQCPGSTCSAAAPCSNQSCRGGPYNGISCTSGTDCTGCNPNNVCTGASTPLACCTGTDAGTCPVVGSCALVQNPLFAVRLGLNGVCAPRVAPDVACVVDADCPAGKTCQASGFDLQGFDQGGGRYSLLIPEESLFLPPSVVSGIGTVCVVAGGDGVGTLDCTGGLPNLNFTLSVDHNTTPAFTCLDGTRKGMTCSTAADCPGLQAFCSPSTNTCASGANQGMACTSNADCPAFAPCNNDPTTSPVAGNGGPANGLPDDPDCMNTFIAPTGMIDYACLEGTRQCEDGPNDGMVCTSDGDCPESTCGGLCNTASQHPATCNSPTVVEIGGTFAPGDMVVTLPLAISILDSPAQFGADGLACTGDDMPPNPPAAVPVALSTGLNSINVYDAANSPGLSISPGATCGGGLPCVAQVDGQGLSCQELLTSGSLSGVIMGGGFPALDTAAGDIATVFQFVVP